MRLSHNNFLTQCSFYAAAFGLSLGIVSPTFAADNITLHIKGKPLVVTISQLEDYSQTGDLSSLPPEIEEIYPYLEPEEQDAFDKFPAQLKGAISIRPGEQLDPDEQEALDFLIPSSDPQEQQQAIELMAEKGNGQILLNFLKVLPVKTLTQDNFVSVLTAYVPRKVKPPAKTPTSRATLYGITSDGFLLKIDTQTGAGTPVRSQLTPEFRHLDSLGFAGDHFYTSRNGTIIRFGFTDGDEMVVGDSGFPWVEQITERPDGTLFASISRDPAPLGEAIGQLDSETGKVSNIIVSGNQSVAHDLDAIAFDLNNTLYGINLLNPRALFSFDLVNGTIADFVPLSNIYSDLAIDWNTNTFFATHRHSGTPTALPSELFIIEPTTGHEILVGNIGYANVTSLTFVRDRNTKLTSVPEPTSLVGLLGLGAFGAVSLLKRKQ